MIEITGTVLIFGRSPFIKQIDIDRLLSLGYTTIGINQQDFKTDIVTFLDEGMALIHDQIKGTIVTQPRYEVREPVIYFDSWSYDFTHDYILRWLKGRCSEAILIGAADFEGNEHYNSKDPFVYHEDCLPRSIKFIESIKEFKVYKMNPNGILNVPVKSI